MNYKLITSEIKRGREYKEFISEILNKRKISSGQKTVYVSGLTEGADEYFLSAAVSDLMENGDSVLILYPDDTQASSSAEFLMECGIKALKYPSRDYNFNNMTSSHDFENERITVLCNIAKLAGGSPCAVCAGISAALQTTIPLKLLKSMALEITPETEIDYEELPKMLISIGYTKVDVVEGPGQFAVRGGIIDIFTPLGSAYRLEFFGDEIDRMGYFDTGTQRFTEFCNESIIIPPAREIVISDAGRAEISELIREHLKKLKGNCVEPSALRSKEILSSELSDTENGCEMNFSDKYIPVIYKESECLIDNFGGTIIMFSPLELEKRAGAAELLIEQSITDMLEHYELPHISQYNGCYMKSWDAVSEKLLKVPSAVIDTISRSHTGNFNSRAEFDFETRHISAYGGRNELFLEDVRGYSDRGWTSVAVCSSEAERAALTNKLVEEGFTAASGENIDGESEYKAGIVYTLTGTLNGGFELPRQKFSVMNYSLGSKLKKSARIIKNRAKKKTGETIMSYADLEVGDLVVHATYGIGQFMGIENLTVAGNSRDYVSIKYAGTDQLFLPVDQLDLVSKYIGAGSDNGCVKLSKMGGGDWTKAKAKAKAATREMAKELIELYAARRRTKGISFDPDDDMCREFAASFEYEETEGQINAIEDVRRDMEASYPMDRLICGDVGYGKTEVALRAAFKAVMSGKQVAILVPTTILAYQHYKNFKSRLRQFPANVDMISRFRSASEQNAALRKLRRGETDIIIGTHRIISSDVEFYDLGLIIIDEEQRFGVAQKEKLKKTALGADILTLTATPIPRTLNMAMGGIVDMSLLDEAPGQRAPVQTYVLEYDDTVIIEALRRELRRSGQAFYLYNRVEGIYNVAARIGKAIPDARIAVAHGKMEREELEEIWEALIRGEVDILVCTTIIETGVDIPNANTLIIEHADMYGLAQLHQIRGRVGRSGRRAYAYFTYKKNKNLSEIAQKRLMAIKEYAQFGAGFRIALRDLEIRGAGNLLGAEQHGHMEAVGYDLYMKLLNEAVIEEKGGSIEKKTECTVDIKADAYLSKKYIPFSPQRMELYKKISRIDNEEDYEDMIDEMCDRFGEPGSAALNLCKIALIKALASHAGMTKIEEREGEIRIIPEQVDVESISALAEKYKQYKFRMSLGAKPSVICRIPSVKKSTDFLIEAMKSYISIIKSRSGSDEK